MKHVIRAIFIFTLSLTPLLAAGEDAAVEETADDGYLGIEASGGYNMAAQSDYWRAPLFFTGGSAHREISTRFLILSDLIHASQYFSGDNSFLKNKGLYLYNYGLLDVDYISWTGRIWSAGFGAGLAHQGFLVSGAEKSSHAITLRLRGQAFIFWWEYLATQFVATVPVALYQSATDEFKLLHTEVNMLFDFKGKVRKPEPQSFMFSVSLHYDYIHLNHSVRNYSYHDFTPMFKATVLY